MKTRRREFLERSGLTGLRLNPDLLEDQFKPKDPDRDAAWDLYVEFSTRVTAQNLPPDAGEEKAALASVDELFPLTRDILKKHGAEAGEFAKLSIPVLNQVIRPFTTKWHKVAQQPDAFNSPAQAAEFRAELASLQVQLHNYTRALASMADVEDLALLETGGPH